MSHFVVVAALALATFLVAWIANALVGLLMGEKPRDTVGVWFDTFFGMFALLELGFIGRMLTNFGLTGWPRKAVLFIGLVCVFVFLARACSHDTHKSDTNSYPMQTQTVKGAVTSP